MSEKKKKYCVTIVETLEVAVSVFAESEEQAHELVSNMYYGVHGTQKRKCTVG